MRVRRLGNRVTGLETQISNVSNKIDSLSTKVDMFISEVREQNKQRAAEIAALDAKMSKMQEQTDARFAKIEEKLDNMGNHVRNMAVTAMVSVLALYLLLQSSGLHIRLLRDSNYEWTTHVKFESIATSRRKNKQG